jgi:hypothetical protein
MMIFFLFLKTLIIGAIIGGCLYAFASKESESTQLVTSTGVTDPQNGSVQNSQATTNLFAIILRFIRNLVYLVFIILIPLIIVRFII